MTKELLKAFKSYEPGYLHMDVKYLPQLADEAARCYLFVAIKSNKTAASARSFLKALHKACPIKIVKLLTDNGKEFTDRLFTSREREPTGQHKFDQPCTELGIERRLTKPRPPKPMAWSSASMAALAISSRPIALIQRWT